MTVIHYKCDMDIRNLHPTHIKIPTSGSSRTGLQEIELFNQIGHNRKGWNAKIWKQPRCPSTGECSPAVPAHHRAPPRDDSELLIHTTTAMGLEGFKPSK